MLQPRTCVHREEVLLLLLLLRCRTAGLGGDGLRDRLLRLHRLATSLDYVDPTFASAPPARLVVTIHDPLLQGFLVER